jgi:hypothetical protein
MIKNNLFGQILIGLLVFFLLLSSVQMFGWGTGIDSVVLDENNADVLPVLPKATQSINAVTLDDRKNMVETINEHPMFSTSRTPFIEEIEPTDAQPEEGPISELKAELTGVVITPHQSYAMILDTITNQKETYQVGMPLQGEQGGWTLNSIQSRKVVFVSDDDKTEELELVVFSGSMLNNKPVTGGKSKPQLGNSQASGQVKQQSNNGNNQASNKENKKNADDIRKKIAERRAKMRADAAKKQ